MTTLRYISRSNACVWCNTRAMRVLQTTLLAAAALRQAAAVRMAAIRRPATMRPPAQMQLTATATRRCILAAPVATLPWRATAPLVVALPFRASALYDTATGDLRRMRRPPVPALRQHHTALYKFKHSSPWSTVSAAPPQHALVDPRAPSGARANPTFEFLGAARGYQGGIPDPISPVLSRSTKHTTPDRARPVLFG